MTIYNNPRNGTYYFKVSNFDGTFTRYSTKVTVVGETDKSYQIILQELIRTHFIGDKIWVAKKNIRIDDIDVSGFWYNEID